MLQTLSNKELIEKCKKEVCEIYHFRNTLKSLIVKNLIGRYRNSLLGFLWHFIMPIVMMFVYYIVFTYIRSNPIPNFWIYLSCALFPFNYMINNLTNGSGCIISNSGIIKKIYFPRIIIVLSQIISSFIIMLIGYTIVMITTIVTGHVLHTSILMLPSLFIIMAIFTFGYVLFFSAITVYVKDVQHLLNSFSMMFFFLTPMYFSLNDVEGILGTIVHMNPMSYFIESFHQIVYYGTIPFDLISICCLIAILSFIIGIITFGKLKHGFVERL